MEPLEGFAPSQQLPGSYGTDPTWRRSMGEQLVRGAAALAAVDYKAVGLGDLGKPDGWHGRQVERWRSQLDGYRRMPNYDGALPHVDEVGRWLSDNPPTNQRIGIVHGDFQFVSAGRSFRCAMGLHNIGAARVPKPSEPPARGKAPCSSLGEL